MLCDYDDDDDDNDVGNNREISTGNRIVRPSKYYY